jgi:DNA invertase Pin-like site-specific DNA recombinase
MVKKSKRVALYARVSTDQQTVDNQLHELRAWAERGGHEVVKEYTDNGRRGTSGRHWIRF